MYLMYRVHILLRFRTPYSVLRTLRRMPILRCDLSEIGHVKRALGANLDLRLMRRGSALRPSLCRYLRTQVHNILRTTVLPILLSMHALPTICCAIMEYLYFEPSFYPVRGEESYFVHYSVRSINSVP